MKPQQTVFFLLFVLCGILSMVFREHRFLLLLGAMCSLTAALLADMSRKAKPLDLDAFCETPDSVRHEQLVVPCGRLAISDRWQCDKSVIFPTPSGRCEMAVTVLSDTARHVIRDISLACTSEGMPAAQAARNKDTVSVDTELLIIGDAEYCSRPAVGKSIRQLAERLIEENYQRPPYSPIRNAEKDVIGIVLRPGIGNDIYRLVLTSSEGRSTLTAVFLPREGEPT